MRHKTTGRRDNCCRFRGALAAVVLILAFVIGAAGAPRVHAQTESTGRGAGDQLRFTVTVAGDLVTIRTLESDFKMGCAGVFERRPATGEWLRREAGRRGSATERDLFGYAIALSGDYAVVGAEWHDRFKGAAYIFRRAGDRWVEEQRLSPSDLGRFDHFGGTVSIRGDYAVVGATWQDNFKGAVYVFRRVGGEWVEEQKLTASDAVADLGFGLAVRIDDREVIVGVDGPPQGDSVPALKYTFRRSAGTWVEQGKVQLPVADTSGDAGGLSADSVEPLALDLINEIRFVPDWRPPPAPEDTTLNAPPPTRAVVATDGTFEDRVEITWASVGLDAIVYRVLRDGVLMSVASSEDSLYVDETGVPGIGYDYCVVVRDMAGVDSDPVCDEGSRIIFAPTEVSASDGRFDEFVRVIWNDMSSIEAGYVIKRDGTGIDSTSANVQTFDDSTAVPDSTYSYEVVAFDADGNLSEGASDTGFRGRIMPPLQVSASDGEFNDRVVVTWIDQADNEGGYIVRRDGAVLDTTGVDVDSYDDVTAAFGVAYEYCVTTLGVDPVLATPVESIPVCDEGGRGILRAPTNVSASDSTFDDGVEITWDDPSDLEDGFEIWRDGALLETVGADRTSYKDGSADPGTTHDYCVVAYSDSGGRSEEVCDDGFRSVVLAPFNVSATDGAYENRVEITWESNSSTAVLYMIYRDATFIKSVSVGGRTHTDYGGTAGDEYDYSVVAVTALGDESAPGSDTGSRELWVPEPVEASDDAYEDKVLVSWVDRSLTESGYVVFREDTLTGVVDTLGIKGSNSESYSDFEAVPGRAYIYRVAAFDTLGEGWGESEAAEDPGRRILRPPSDVRASDGDFEDRVEITWNDNSQAEDGYYIYRDSALIDSTADNYTSYFDMSPIFGNTSEYGVRAFDSQGESDPTADGSFDTGFTTVMTPGSFNASDVYPDRVRLTWVDLSEIESKYIIFRDGVVIDSTNADSYMYNDYTAVSGTTYEYCVRSKWCDATCSAIALSPPACDDGQRTPWSVPTEKAGAYSKLYGGPRPAGGDQFGDAVAVDRDLIVVGAPQDHVVAGSDGAGHIFERDAHSGDWSLVFHAYEDATGGTAEALDNFGSAVAVYGDWALFGTPGDDGQDGAVFVAERDAGGAWAHTFKIELPPSGVFDRLGCSVAVDGAEAVIGARGDSGSRGAAYIFRRNPDATWSRTQKLTGAGGGIEDLFGTSVAKDGELLIVGAPEANVKKGAAYIFGRGPGGSWSQRQMLVAGDGETSDEFGCSVATNGDAAIVGARYDDDLGANAGAAYVFTKGPGGVWSQTQKLHASDGGSWFLFGETVAIYGDVAIIGSSWDINEKGSRAGAAYMFARGADGTWSEYRKILANDGGANEYFGCSVAMDGEVAVLGARLDSDYDTQAGSAYVLELSARPGAVAASDGKFNTRVRVRWNDRSSHEEGYNVYRDGELIATVAKDVELYEDNEAQAGRAYEYEVESFGEDYMGLGPVGDYGWRPPDGNITGRISTPSGAGVEYVAVCLDPDPARALLLDGEGGQVRIRDDGTFNFEASDDFTVELWFHYNGFGGSGPQNDALIAKAEPGAVSYPFMLSNRRAEGYPARLAFKISDGTPREVSTGELDIVEGWHHAACVHDAGQDELRIYVDGVLEGTTSYAGLGAIGNSDDLMLSLGDVADSWFAGRLDEVRIWNVVRSEGEVQRMMTRPLTGEEEGLVGYWPADGGVGGLLIDLAGGAHYGILEGGVYWSENSAPLEGCATTDEEGNYSRARIRYGEETTFKVRPLQGDKQFSPVFKMITLNPENPVENQVDFFETTSYTVSGTVKFADYDCPVPDVTILVDGEMRGATDKRGKFAVAVPQGEHWFRPRLGDHTFAPDSISLEVNDDMSGVDFEDTTTRALSGRVGGGCNRYVGLLTIEYTSENNCMSGSTVTDSLYSISLPPQKYFVSAPDIEVGTIPDGLDKADVVRFFRNLGIREIDLSAEDAELDFTYRGPLLVSITGLDPYRISCPLTFEERTLPGNLPVVDQLEVLDLAIEVGEYYGEDGQGAPVICPLDSGKVVIYDEIFDKADEPVELVIKDGVAQYKTVATTPSLIEGRVDSEGNDRSFQKALRAVVYVEGKDPVTETEWVLVTGHVAPEGADFVTFTSNEIPLYILRDPPGDNSSAYLQKGHKARTTVFHFKNVRGEQYGAKTEAEVGLEVDWFVGVGGGKIFEVEASAVFEMEAMLGKVYEDELKIDVTFEATDKYSTSGSESFIGEDGDVFVGAGLNYIFSEVRKIEVDEVACEVSRSTELGFQPDGISTTFAYTERYIEDVLIPQLERAVDDAKAKGDQEAAGNFETQVANWQGMLEENRRLKREAKTTENRSFSAGADFEHNVAHGTTVAYTKTLTLTADLKLFAGLKAKFEGFEGKGLVGVSLHNELAITLVDLDQEWTKGVGYTLSDDDDGDHFTVDIKHDGRYPSPVFDVLAGVSSCPHEPWPDPNPGANYGKARMLKRDVPQLFIRPSPVQGGVAADEPAVFALDLVNNSETHERRSYVLKEITTSNPGGAIIKANGQGITNGISYSIDPDMTQEVTLTVERGPSKYRYEDLAVKLYSSCDGDQEDTQQFTVYFDAPCSDIAMVNPEPGWAFNKADHDTLEGLDLLFADYEMVVGEDEELDWVGAQYRRMGVGLEGPTPWKDIGQVEPVWDPETRMGSTEFQWPISSDPSVKDGVYELRAFAQCEGGRGYSAVAIGTIDRKGPKVFGTPEPADGELSFGEDISVTFDEPIDCGSVDADSVTLRYVSGPNTGTAVAVETFCDGRTIVIAPAPEVDLNELEDMDLEVSVSALRDLMGNPMDKPATWSFHVRRSEFAWSQAGIAPDVAFRAPGSVSAELVNGRDTTAPFIIRRWPWWVTEVSPSEGDIPAGGTQLINFTIWEDLPIGSYGGQVQAEADFADGKPGKGDLIRVYLRFDSLTVSCHEPVWKVNPSSYEHTMTIVANVDIGGVLSADTNDKVAALVGNQFRGVANVDSLSHMAYLTVHSNRASGETVRFQVWDDSDCMEYNSTLERFAFVSDGRIGSPDTPVTLTAVNVLPDSVQVIPLSEGWSWFSTNLVGVDMSVNGVLSDLIPAGGDIIKSQTAYAEFDPEMGWVGTLQMIDNVSSYMIDLSEPGTILQEGSCVDPSTTPVPVENGWNWIGYVPAGSLDVDTALGGLNPVVSDGDMVKSQNAFAQSAHGEWLGDLVSMEPGRGYKLYLASAGPPGAVFYYPGTCAAPPPPLAALTECVTGGGARALRGSEQSANGRWGTAGGGRGQLAEVAEQVTDPVADTRRIGPEWFVHENAFQYNMTVTAVLKVEGEEWRSGDDMIGAFVGGECRGVTQPIYLNAIDRYVAFLMVHSNEVAGEAVTLKAFVDKERAIYSVAEGITYEADRAEGTLRKPLVLNTGSVEHRLQDDVAVYSLSQNYPNPFRGDSGTRIHYTVPKVGVVEVRIFDAGGRLVKRIVGHAESGDNFVVWDGRDSNGRRAPSGVYFYQLRAGEFTSRKKMLLAD